MKRSGFPLVALAMLLAFGCARRATVPAPSATPSVVSPPAVSAADTAYAAGAAALAEGNHERSLELFAAAWKDNPEHPGVARDFPDALARLKNGGDESSRQGRIEEAGRRWSAALRYSAILAEKGRQLPFARTELRSGIDRASAALMEKGLVEYRKGNLESAIAIWKSILAYDPSHAEAARSVKTASTQLENLKKISPPK
ncbi:MAG: hypothetical protein M0Z38_01215 [Deltaproteobacteria bacterium]|nr:hypothetical protein [Deltaproteobacteria bacterium]